jgi:hypothetical protein
MSGFIANFLVILSNGGFMPISPDTIDRMIPEGSTFSYQLGQRLGTGKDIVLEEKNTIFAFLSDMIVSPRFLNYSFAFSLGDVLISIGVIWLFWSLGGPQKKLSETK